MKILIALGFICLFSAGVASQSIESLVVKLPQKMMSVDSVLLVVRQQHKIVFSYGNNLNINMNVKFEKKQLTLLEILKTIAAQIECDYKIQKNKVVLYPNGRKRTVFVIFKDINKDLSGKCFC